MDQNQDEFDNLFRDRFLNFEVKRSESDWAMLESRLNIRKNKRRIVWYSGVAASLILLVYLLIPENKQIDLYSENEIKNPIVIDSIRNITPVTKETLVSYKKQESLNLISSKSDINTVKSDKIANVTILNKEKTIDKSDVAEQNPVDDQINNNGQVDGSINGSNPIDRNEQVMDKIQKEETIEPKFNASFYKKNRSPWTLVASAGAMPGDMSNKIQQGNMPLSSPNNYQLEQVYRLPSLTSELLESSIYDNVSHNLPLSFGVKLRKQIGKRWNIESGLVYSYLSSNFKTANKSYKQELNYLGVPLNISCKIMHKPMWSIYAVGGTMVEKGLTSNIYNGNTLIKNHINGLQWSLRGGLGANYTLFKHTSLFLESELSHFFDNKQPRSIRTDQNIIFGLNAGLLFSF